MQRAFPSYENNLVERAGIEPARSLYDTTPPLL
jgi:hypothetical protein